MVDFAEKSGNPVTVFLPFCSNTHRDRKFLLIGINALAEWAKDLPLPHHRITPTQIRNMAFSEIEKITGKASWLKGKEFDTSAFNRAEYLDRVVVSCEFVDLSKEEFAKIIGAEPSEIDFIWDSTERRDLASVESDHPKLAKKIDDLFGVLLYVIDQGSWIEELVQFNF